MYPPLSPIRSVLTFDRVVRLTQKTDKKIEKNGKREDGGVEEEKGGKGRGREIREVETVGGGSP